MKNLKSLKKMGVKSTALLLCLATSATAATLAVPALRGASADTAVSGPQISVVQNVKLDKTCDYGKTFNVPAGAIVTSPDGEVKTYTEATDVLANQVGNYKVRFEKDGAGYDFYVRVRMEEEYTLKVDYNGADIPSYIAVDGTFELPKARVVYFDDDNILRELDEKSYTVTARDSRGTDYSFGEGGNRTFNAGKTTGKVFITYDAVIGNGGTKHLSQTFTVNVQSSVQRTGNPTLSVSGVQSTGSVNRALTLPKAVATDLYDDNVKVVISVEGPDSAKGTGSYPVRTVDIDENGYAYRDANNDAKYTEILFDNDGVMTFYPTEIGTYKVTYTAYSDAYDGGNTGKSATRTYSIEVSDLVAPVFKNIEEWRIPETWGLHVSNADGEISEKSGKITFTIPELVDNKDKMPKAKLEEGEEEGDDLVSLYFRITDADNSQTILSFNNILSNDKKDEASTESTKPGQFKYNDIYEKGDDTSDVIKFNLDNNTFTFDFNKYNKKNSAGEKQDLAGEYTVLYRARDKANNTASRTFTIKLEENYTDDAKPTTAEVTVPDYISVADKTFTVPQSVVADAKDSRLKKDYRIYTDKANAEPKFVDVEGGEVADIIDGKLVFNNGKTNKKSLELGEKLYFYVAATDNVGNFKSNCVDNNTELDLTDPANADKFTNCKASLTVVPDAAKAFKFDGTNMTAAKVPGAGDTTEESKNTLYAQDNVKFGGFTIETEESMRYYTGFEVAAYDPKGNNINVTLLTSSKITESGKALIVVRDIQFNVATATADGEAYTLVVRVFDVNGNSEVYGYKVTGVVAKDDDKVQPSAITEIGSTADAYVTYKLRNTSFDINGSSKETYRITRKISGGIFAVMGNELTAKTQGAYTVNDGYAKDEGVTADGITVEEIVDTYSWSVSDTSSPVIDVQGVMPTYKDFPKAEGDTPAKKNVTVELPAIIAYTENGVAEVKIEVKNPKGSTVKYDEEHRTFEATMDGTYTVTVTATYKSAAETTATYNINIGDVQGPEFKLTEGTATSATYTVGQVFKFAKLELIENESGVEITKKLINPSNETVSDATITGSYQNNKERQDNGTDIKLDMAGTYKIVYTATDANGNETKQEFEITVLSNSANTPTTWTTLSTVLIIVAIVLLAGVIVYVVRFRKVKK
ncbi:MAG: hypothetical protein OSJ83_07830 [Clostridia bacterium]|nr:hypothetical protein [Clostridia bacterium]